jgi:hypothetical protein
MGFKGFSLSYVAVDPLDEDENFEEESAEIATPFPGYLPGGPSKFGRKKNEDDDENNESEEEEEENENKKFDEDLDEDLVTDNEHDNYIYNSNRIGKENAEILSKSKKKEEID